MAHDVMIYPRAFYIVPLGAVLVVLALLICFFAWVVLSVQNALNTWMRMMRGVGTHA